MTFQMHCVTDLEALAQQDLMARGFDLEQAKSLWWQLSACQDYLTRFSILANWCTALNFDPTSAADWLQRHGLGRAS